MAEEGTGCMSCSTCSCGWKVCLTDDDRIDTIVHFLPILKKKKKSNINIQNKVQTLVSAHPTVMQNLFHGEEVILLGSAYEFLFLFSLVG